MHQSESLDFKTNPFFRVCTQVVFFSFNSLRKNKMWDLYCECNIFQDLLKPIQSYQLCSIYNFIKRCNKITIKPLIYMKINACLITFEFLLGFSFLSFVIFNITSTMDTSSIWNHILALFFGFVFSNSSKEILNYSFKLPELSSNQSKRSIYTWTIVSTLFGNEQTIFENKKIETFNWIYR